MSTPRTVKLAETLGRAGGIFYVINISTSIAKLFHRATNTAQFVRQ